MHVIKHLLFILVPLLAVSAYSADHEISDPIESFLGITRYSDVAVSPDGRHVAFVATKDDFDADEVESAIWRIDLDGRSRKLREVRLASSTGNYRQLQWTPDGRYLAFLHSPPATKPQLYVLDMQGGEARRLTDPEHFSDGIGTFGVLDATTLAIAAPVPSSEEEKAAIEEFYGDVERYASEPTSTTIAQVAATAEDAAGEEIATVDFPVSELSASPDGSHLALKSTVPSNPKPFANDASDFEIHILASDGSDGARQLTQNYVDEFDVRWSPDGESLLAVGVGDPDASQIQQTQGLLFRIGLDGNVEQLASSFSGSFFPAYVALADGSLVASAALSTRTNVYRVDGRDGATEALTDFAGAVSELSASADGTVLAFELITDRSAPEIYVASGLERLGEAVAVTSMNDAIDGPSLTILEPISWENGEGDTIEGILFWPPGRRGEKGLPLVVDIHGGPWSLRTENIGPINALYYPALLASRGFLVLEPNYRGSTGRGPDFLSAIEGFSCSRPATDVMTGVDYLIEQGWGDPDRMAVMGYSYGGLMTNCLIGRTNRFSVAVSGAGVWNDISYFGSADNFFQNRIRNGNAAPWENLENYWDESAISRAGDITTPTLVTIGGADRRVPTSQGLELYRALTFLGVPTELLVFPGEPHIFRGPKHKLTKVKAELQWIERYLLGRTQPP